MHGPDAAGPSPFEASAALRHLRMTVMDWMRDAIPDFASLHPRHALQAYQTDRKVWPMRPAIFFDCDGVLNEEPGGHGVLGPDDVRLIPGAGEAVRAARDAGYLAIIVTNRAQVAKGFVTLAGLEAIFARIRELLAQDDATIDAIYFCPHHPEQTPGGAARFQIACECRKPGTLLFRRATADFGIDLGRSALIGDSLRDIGAGCAMGLRAYGVHTGYGCRDVERYPDQAPPVPDRMFSDVREAVAFCVTHRAIAEPGQDVWAERKTDSG
ncbi:D-glycero-D-manno-heptose 1,7-bisphosphate phosphatase [Bradyrhizobium sp. F1.4.3]|uniref:D-glycero-alpha-D-manno-heptose-1,7-bisphosphate 7-phosphatase n=1 Tax=Bradyrhizobium sp. F1.4.3 TaxID=3156356 RepID=UPI003399F049